MKTVKALVLFSGGLDSLLAIKLLEAQAVQVTALIFKSYFFTEERAVHVCRLNKINFKVVDFSAEHLAMVKQPKHGYGKAINPCIDCHTLMLKKAKQIMQREKYDFVATGEVLGQRPMSQNPRALKIVAQESGLDGFLLRPLSAQKMPLTQAEQIGLVKRDKLLGLQGRSRKTQLALAKKYKLKGFSAPAGGCLLTDKIFAQRLKELFACQPDCSGSDIELLKYGRHFWQNKANPAPKVGARVKIIVGRNHSENQIIKSLAGKGDILVEMQNYNGPTTLIRNYGHQNISSETINKAQELTQFYSTKARNQQAVKFNIKNL